MATATFRHGEPRMIDHTPGADVAAGAVVVVGDMPLIAHRDIVSGQLGALAAGGGVYRVTANALIAKGVKVWWDAATSKVSTTAGSLKIFGMTVSASTADGTEIDVLHTPIGLDALV